MHYRNGKEAKNGDHIVVISSFYKTVQGGILFGATPGNDYCNGYLAQVPSNPPGVNLKDALLLEDFLKYGETGLPKNGD